MWLVLIKDYNNNYLPQIAFILLVSNGNKTTIMFWELLRINGTDSY